eukprot:5475935-Amphidinium_carterae.1
MAPKDDEKMLPSRVTEVIEKVMTDYLRDKDDRAEHISEHMLGFKESRSRQHMSYIAALREHSWELCSAWLPRQEYSAEDAKIWTLELSNDIKALATASKC